MEIQTHDGLRVAVVTAGEALNLDWFSLADEADLARVLDPPRERWEDLAAAGFWAKPSWLVWATVTGDSDDDFLSRLTPKQRRFIAAGRRRLADNGWTVGVRPLNEALLDGFLSLYDKRIESMRNGVAVASRQRDAIAADLDRYFAACVWDGDRLLGAFLNQVFAEAGVVRFKFSAIDERVRADRVSAVLTLTSVAASRDQGFSDITMGSDPNLYGHLVQPGLIRFKAGLGFRPVPSQSAYPHKGSDHADRILSLAALSDPTIHFCYLPARAVDDGLNPHLISRSETVATEAYLPTELGPVRQHRITARPATGKEPDR